MQDEPRLYSLSMTAAYFRLILRRFGNGAARRRALLAGTGVEDAESRDEISVGAQMRQLANLAALAGPDWGLVLGSALDGAAHGPAGSAIVTAPTIGAALETLARYATVRTPFIDLQGRRRAGCFELAILETCPLASVRTQVLEMVLLSTQGVLESALGRPITEASFTMPAPRPLHAASYADHFHAPVRFTGHTALVRLPLEWLALPCPLADSPMHRAARSRLEILRQQLAADRADARVESLLQAGDDRGASLAEMAARLRLSPRTLVRRLSLRQTTYRRLLEAHRRQRATELLRQPELSIGEVAARVGYEDSTNFARACRRWFGVSPGVWREENTLQKGAKEKSRGRKG